MDNATIKLVQLVPPYNGDPMKYLGWKEKITMVYLMKSADVSDEQFIMLLGMRLEGMAQDWFSLWRQNRPREGDVPAAYTQWPAFLQQIDAKFVSDNVAKRLRTEYWQCKQKPNETIYDYIARFDRLRTRNNSPASEAISLFEQGVHRHYYQLMQFQEYGRGSLTAAY